MIHLSLCTQCLDFQWEYACAHDHARAQACARPCAQHAQTFDPFASPSVESLMTAASLLLVSSWREALGGMLSCVCQDRQTATIGRRIAEHV